MEIKELLSRLDQHQDSFPHDLVEEAIARREEVIPKFLEILEDIDKNPDSWAADQDCMVHIFAMYLLAFFREERAYPLLVKIFARPGEFPFDLAGDVVTQSLADILASVSGGNTAGMIRLIEDEHVNEWVRSQAVHAISQLVITGQRSRDEVMSYFLELFHKLEQKHSAVWDGLASACCDLWPHEALDELNRAYEDRLIEPWSINWNSVKQALALGKEGAQEKTRQRGVLVNDVAYEMGWMVRFQKKERFEKPKESLPEHQPALIYAGIMPMHRDKPKVGRNDPCSCGSGKKFKKCCGAIDQSPAPV